jgi:hypothetical protein
VTCHPYSPCAARQKNLTPVTPPPGAPNRPHHRTGIATPTTWESAPESGTASAPADGKAAPHTGAARTQPTAKRKTPRTPRQPEYLPLTSPALGSWP